MAKVATMSASIISRLGEDTCFSTAGSNQENAKIPAVVHLQAFGTYDSLPVLDLQPAIGPPPLPLHCKQMDTI